MASGQDVRTIHVAEVVDRLLGVAVTIARTLRWLGTYGLLECAIRTFRTVQKLIDAAPRAAAVAKFTGKLVEQDLVSQVCDKVGTSIWRENEQDRALNRVQRDVAANGIHRRDYRDHDKGKKMSITVAKSRVAPFRDDALQIAASFDNQPVREELESASVPGLSLLADASVPSMIVRYPSCNNPNGFVASRLTISDCRNLVSCLPKSLPDHSIGCRRSGISVTARITLIAA